MYTGLLHLHSTLRYIVLILLVIAVIKALINWQKNKDFKSGDKKIYLFTLIATHVQLLIGLILYFVSPIVDQVYADFGAAMKNAMLRFWGVEHFVVMLIAIILITIGYSSSKKAAEAVTKHKRVAIFYLIGLVLILISIPWPFSSVARPWF
ncbi:putative membrane protein [Catalinimonas alkaloidigena]|uniref:cytochrome B n=1 Tax=Catalinimonas alkaloidigena TaxID=1075417 RepID=UPI0024064161|nr:cytochrome B [Catalinimonas alkaloidigena]MDF9795108.1 putative membrane protein [Catalinimonas alkaloidigena]